MGNLIWHEYSRLVAITASVCESFVLPLSPGLLINLATRAAVLIVRVSREYLQIHFGPAFGVSFGASFSGTSLEEQCETQEDCSEFTAHAYTDLKSVPT